MDLSIGVIWITTVQLLQYELLMLQFLGAHEFALLHLCIFPVFFFLKTIICVNLKNESRIHLGWHEGKRVVQ